MKFFDKHINTINILIGISGIVGIATLNNIPILVFAWACALWNTPIGIYGSIKSLIRKYRK